MREAIRLNPNSAEAHRSLGKALAQTGRLDEAVGTYRRAAELAPKHFHTHYDYGTALQHANRPPEEAEAAFRRAIELNPDFAEAHCNLGGALRNQGRMAESLAAYRRGHELGRRQPGWNYPSALWVREGEALAAVEAKLTRVLAGEAQPADAAERVALAHLCHTKKRYAAAARFFADAFAAQPALADNLQTQDRYNAACAAARAAAGQGDADRLADAERARLRRQALDWLAADLAAWAKRAENPNALARLWDKVALPGMGDVLGHWQTDPDLAGVRDDAALARLPEADREAWRKLWAEVAATLAKARAGGAPAGKSDKQP
jgi:Tfp pilus assembly protein PilF